MKIIPAIDIIGGKTVRLEQGQYDRKLSYDMKPIDAAREWEAMGAELIHVIDLDGAREGRPVNLDVVTEIARTVNVPVELGGGYRKEIDIKKALDNGVWRVIVGSRAFEDFDFARNCIDNFKDRIILSIDAEDYKPLIRGWEEPTEFELFYMLQKFVSFGAKEIIYTDVKRDGTLAGPNIEMITEILEKVNVKVIAAGGVKTIAHIEELKKLEEHGLSGVIIGRALYDGTINLKEAINAGKKNNPVPGR